MRSSKKGSLMRHAEIPDPRTEMKAEVVALRNSFMGLLVKLDAVLPVDPPPGLPESLIDIATIINRIESRIDTEVL